MTSQRLILAGVTVFVSVCAVLVAITVCDARRIEAAKTPTPVSRCGFEAGAHGAFRVATSAFDTRAVEQKDRFTAVLSWETAERPSATTWRLRAAFSDVQHDQSLTLSDQRVVGGLDAPFFVDVDEACRFVGFGFARSWTAPQRLLVQTLLTSWEHVLPAEGTAQTWRARQTDGLGSYEARYQRRGDDVERSKAAYEGEAAARAMGLSLRVVSSRASARFQDGFVATVKGHEHVRIELAGELQADLIQRFSAVRDDARFVAIARADARDADFADAFAFVAQRGPELDATVLQLDFDQALARFLGQLTGPQQTFRAARDLAAWLRAHPAYAAQLLAELKAGRVPELARPGLFLAMELSGTEQSRAALSLMLDDAAFTTLDRARAASALSDLGTPTREVAALLRAQGLKEGMVGNVGLLGLGNLGRRAEDDALRGYVRETLTQEMAAASSTPRKLLVLDAMGNSRDPKLADAVASTFEAADGMTRRHAAAALGRMPADVATPRLVAQLAVEQNADVAAALVRALDRTHPSPELVQTLIARLGASQSTAERRALIAWLGAASGSMLDARTALAAHFQVEPDARLQQQIGSFLPASALR